MAIDLVGKMVHIGNARRLFKIPDEVIGAVLSPDGAVTIVITDSGNDYELIRINLPADHVSVFVCQGPDCTLCASDAVLATGTAR